MNSAKRPFRKISSLTLTALLLLSSSLQSSEGFLPEQSVPSAPIAQATLSKEQQQNIEEIRLAIDEIGKIIPLRQNRATLFVGDTGEGKTYLLNYLAGIPLTGKIIEGSFGDYVVHTDKPLEGTSVSHGTISSTSLPFQWRDYWDCPGFGDTRGPVQDIANAFSIYKLAKSSDEIKLVIVVSENTIKGARQAKFLNLLNKIEETFKENDIAQGLVFIVTKNKDLNPTLMRKGFSSIVSSQRASQFLFTSSKILELLCTTKSLITFFHAPQKEGPLSSEDKILIQDAIQQSNYFNPRPTISTSAEAEILITVLADELSKDISTFITDQFYQEVLKYCHALIDKHLGIASALREKLKGFAISLQDLTFNQEEFDTDLQKILKIINSLGNKNLEENLLKKMDRLNFIRLVKPATLRIKTQADSWSPQIKQLTKDLVEVVASPEKGKNRDHLTLKGFIVNSSDIQAALKNEGQISELDVYSLNSFFVDEDLNASGLNLTLVAPQWHINGKKLISLKGKAGPSHQIEKAEDGIMGTHSRIHGKNGLPGLPGLNGGHLYAKGNGFTNFSSLTIDVSGGEGGKGQTGGNGVQGLAGEDGGLTDVETRSSPYLVSRKKVVARTGGDYLEKGAKFLLTFNDKFEEVYQSFESGKQGGNAGQGGKGGLGGKAGISRVEFASQQNPNLINNDGDQGSDGKTGEPGAGGRNGPTYKGVYINEIVAPAIRGYKEVIPDISGSVVLGGGLALAVAGAEQTIILPAVKEGVKTLITEAGKEIAEEGIKKGAEILVTQGGKQLGMGIVKEVAKEGAKTTITLGASKVTSAVGGMGVSLLAQTVVSPISAVISSGWKEQPSSIDEGIGQAASGEVATNTNETGIKFPNEISSSINYEEKLTSYQNFYGNKKANKFTLNFL